MATLVIAEKPSVGRVLAKHLGATSQFKGYYIGSGYIVSWAIGHLVDLAPAKAYVDDPWSLEHLPIIPEAYKLVVKPKTKDQFSIVKKLVNKADIIINATDAAREGELIFRRFLEKVPSKGKVIQRLWVSSYTKEDLDKAFSNIKSQDEYTGLYEAGKARSEVDWLFGINTTIAYTLSSMSSSVRSLGRVQTPTFSMIGKAYFEHINFVSEDVYAAEIVLEKDGIEFIAKHKEKAKNKSRVETILSLSGDRATTTVMDKKKKPVKPPKLYELTSLQIDANNKYGLTAQQTLNAAQDLYEKYKLISYPRTDSAYLNNSQMGDITTIINSIYNDEANSELIVIPLRKEPFNDSMVTDHHAIIPTTTNAPENLPKSLKYIYDLIVSRTLAAFSKDAIKASVYISFECNNQVYETRENVFLELGWKNFMSNSETGETELPTISLGEVLPIKSKKCNESKTVAPALPSEAAVLKMMQNCGKLFEDDVDREIKKNGIGTVATRASIIERLVKVGYIERKGKKIIPTTYGLELYSEISSLSISDAALTGNIEKGLDKVANNELTYTQFMSTIKSKIFPKIYNEVISKKPKPINDDRIYCGCCKEDSIRTYKIVYSCTNCDVVIPKNWLKVAITTQDLDVLMRGNSLHKEGLTGSKSKKSFDADIYFSFEDGRIKLKEREKVLIEGYSCPCCKKPLTDHKEFMGCSGYDEGCKFSLSKIIRGYTLSDNEIKRLLNGECIKSISLVSKKKKKYTMDVEIVNGKLQFNFS